ncbi:MAG: M14 family zinc carboxypeptidase [Bdellovibrionales bacterium]
MKSFIFGKSSLGLPLLGVDFEHNTTKDSKHVLLFGGVHGDEIEGVVLARALMGKLIDSPIENIKISVVPEFNIEGILLKTRQNYTGVDLNRNLPTKDWSPEHRKIRYYPGTEPCSENENKALNNYLSENNVDFIISLHSWKPMLNVNADCSPIADHISKETGLIIKDDIGYPTPGSLGTYTGLERNIPTLTYEIQKGIDMEEILRVHLTPMYDSIKLYSEGKK